MPQKEGTEDIRGLLEMHLSISLGLEDLDKGEEKQMIEDYGIKIGNVIEK